MSTVSRGKLGPADHGRKLPLDELYSAEYQEGYRYEIIDGALYVAPAQDLPEGRLDRWIDLALTFYSRERPDVINYTHAKPRVFVHSHPEETVPEPDVAAYKDFPLNAALREIRWQDVSPVLVVEVISADDPKKDYVRNVDLYLEVPSIKEYWIVDGRPDPDEPKLTVYRRRGKRWVVREYAYGDTYTTKLLPDFELVIDPRR
jgi:Uma2 family endonuclease